MAAADWSPGTTIHAVVECEAERHEDTDGGGHQACPLTITRNYPRMRLEQNSAGFQYSSIEWLFLHHAAKLAQRRRVIQELALRPGDKVLDLGCGPGLWSVLIAEQITPGGYLLGVDLDPTAISIAKTLAEKNGVEHVTSFQVSDFHQLQFRDHYFDLAFFSNCFVYCEKVIPLIAELQRVTKSPGRIVGRHFDNTFCIFYPIPVPLQLRMLSAAAESLARVPLTPPFDNSFGQKMHGFFCAAGFLRVETKTTAIQWTQPLDEASQNYLVRTADWYRSIAAPLISEEDAVEWTSYFDPESSTYILRQPDFYACLVEMQSIGYQ
jgi:demethylmenaquinone methyltransferase/2-methoxy-6-polyprenyl-1,4-benzoquinol methylase